MKKITSIATIIGLALALSSTPLLAQDMSPPPSDNAPPMSSSAPDNTNTNMRDRDSSQPTADQAGNQMSDRHIMASIRKAVMADKSLSTYAHNIKIISEDGKVTLKGPVRSKHESQKIMRIATRIAGADNVDNELSVRHHTN